MIQWQILTCLGGKLCHRQDALDPVVDNIVSGGTDLFFFGPVMLRDVKVVSNRPMVILGQLTRTMTSLSFASNGVPSRSSISLMTSPCMKVLVMSYF